MQKTTLYSTYRNRSVAHTGRESESITNIVTVNLTNECVKYEDWDIQYDPLKSEK